MTDSRTWLVSVLFLDIVGYTKVPVDQQLTTKLHFTDIVARETASLDTSECIQLDTGDGCAIWYLGDPEKIYPVATRLRDIFAGLESTDPVNYTVRLGLNLGPVKVVEGISGDKNCIGAGINDAQRIMDFAAENQLLVSKSYFDIVSNMSSVYAEQLSLAGTRADKHDKLHEIYELSSEIKSTDQPRVSSSGFDCEESIRQKLAKEYAKYVGSSEAESVIGLKLGQASSLAELCNLLAESLTEDDRYHFEEFVIFYGYRGSR